MEGGLLIAAKSLLVMLIGGEGVEPYCTEDTFTWEIRHCVAGHLRMGGDGCGFSGDLFEAHRNQLEVYWK